MSYSHRDTLPSYISSDLSPHSYSSYRPYDRYKYHSWTKKLQWIPIYFRRIMNYPQMDFELALWQMLYLCLSPKRVYRNIYYNKQTKNHWARDDPAFVVVLATCILVSAFAYGLAYEFGFLGTLKLMFFMVIVDFLLVGFVVATMTWLFANRFLKHSQVHAVEQNVEWAYAFDVHCNSFFPLYLITYVLHFFLLPILKMDNWFSLFIGNSMYLAAWIYYFYITFLGYHALPFLKNTILFLYPVVLVSVLYIILLICGFNIGKHSSIMFLYI